MLCGDLNVAHQEIDIHNPKTNKNKTPGFCDGERENFTKLLDAGFVDTWRARNANVQAFSYFVSQQIVHPMLACNTSRSLCCISDAALSLMGGGWRCAQSYRFSAKAKNKGWRLDYCVASSKLADRVTDAFIRGDMAGSDHVPIGVCVDRACAV